MSTFPTEAEFEEFFTTLSNWGRWGADDRIGTLNFIDNGVRAHAASLVELGRVVSLARDMDPDDADPLERGTVLERTMEVYSAEAMGKLLGMAPGEEVRLGGVREEITMIPHGSNTHLDGFGHISWRGNNYNNVPATAVRSDGGSTELSVHQAYEGFITRGVLLDITRAKGVDWLEPGYRVTSEDLDEAERLQGIRVGMGDALLLYTGNFKRIAAEGLHSELHHPGFSTEALPWLHDREVSMISSDNINDANPAGFEAKDLTIPVHSVALVAMGLWMVDNMRLDELAATCAELGRWEFMFSMLPWRFIGVTSSPVNPIALF